MISKSRSVTVRYRPKKNPPNYSTFLAIQQLQKHFMGFQRPVYLFIFHINKSCHFIESNVVEMLLGYFC